MKFDAHKDLGESWACAAKTRKSRDRTKSHSPLTPRAEVSWILKKVYGADVYGNRPTLKILSDRTNTSHRSGRTGNVHF